ncbi:MAG: hypothetical protein I8H71_01085 [Xanthomonadaceae bacterium]|nr:hypothetical protein [Xanthomonadaceae bacterium]
MKTEAAEVAIAGVASKSTYAGAGMTVGGWFLSNEFAVASGFLIAVIGLLVNMYYKHRADQRAERLFQARLDRIAQGRRTDTDLATLEMDE